ncbi:MAG: hypothetical protein Q8929_06570 [Bacillota bacterium]|nr:hypothetical protein [Bacillota bacterium]
MHNRKLFISVLMMFLLAIIFVNPAYAMDRNILNEKKTVMPPNEKVDNIVVIGHDIDIKGKVDVSAIVINGNMRISHTARINGIVIVLNGNVQQEPGAYVKENILALKFTNDTLNHLLVAAALLLTSWLLHFVLSVIFVLLTVLTGLLLKNKTEHSIQMFKQQTGKVFLVGIITGFVLLAIMLLLIITIMGIPIAIILAIPPILTFLIGLSIISQYIGEKLFPNSYTALWIKIFAGSFILISIFNFPFFGGIALLCVFWFSSGLLILWVINKLGRKRKK